MVSTESLSLYDIMGEDMEVYVKKNKIFGYDITVEDENGEEKVHEEGVHHCAIDSFAQFCKQFLHFYNKANKANRED